MRSPPPASRPCPTISSSTASPSSSSTPWPGRCSTSPLRRSSIRSAIPTMTGPISAPWRCQQYSDPAGQLRTWARAFVRSTPTDTLALLKDLSAGVVGTDPLPEPRGRRHAVADADARSRLGLVPRLRRAVRRSGAQPGFGARIVSGYLYNPDQDRVGIRAARDRPMPGPRSMCRARAGSPSIRPTAASAASI